MVSVAKPACVIPRNALNDTRDSETKLKASPGVCNETMMALWDECKPCLKQTCMKFYAHVSSCSSALESVDWKGLAWTFQRWGAIPSQAFYPLLGLLDVPGAARKAWLILTREAPLVILHLLSQLEDFLNQSSPFFWINGDRIDSLMDNDRQQSHVMDVMEDSFNRASNTMYELFQDRFFPQRSQDTQYYSPFSSFPRGSLFFNPKSRFAWNLPFPVLEPLNFHDVFQPFYSMIHQAQQAMDAHLHRTPYRYPMAEFAGENNDRTMCKEISYNSTRCLWMKGQCTKCQEILEVDCSANIPTQTLLCQQLNESLQLVEKFSRLCDQLLQSYQLKMLDTTALLKQLIEQLTWVSQLAHLTQNDDQYHLQVSTLSPCWPHMAAALAVQSGGHVFLPGG
ncbi:clusterin-like [Oryx dammah]|uniref:clusterin-like n=1 Tax=Oryx dammah TaxID=59534 RepID=UPI001A9AE207|nr:clusterin-like [Oryx dammah]XP_040120046.1 clusterin-like [Oryx dammah]